MLRAPSCNSFVLLTFLSKDRLGGLRYTIVLFTAAARPFGSLGLCAARRGGAHGGAAHCAWRPGRRLADIIFYLY